MILIDYSNNETIEFQTISQAKMFTAVLFVDDIRALEEADSRKGVNYQTS